MSVQSELRTTLHHKGSAADMCRERGWGPGTQLIGDEGYGPSVIELTAIGENNVLAKCLGHAGHAVEPHENSWVLWCRDWREAAEDEVPVPLAAGQRVVITEHADKLTGSVVSGPDSSGCYVVDADDGQRWIAKSVALKEIP